MRSPSHDRRNLVNARYYCQSYLIMSFISPSEHLAAAKNAASHGDVASARSHLSAAESAAFSVQRYVVESLCEAAQFRRNLEAYRNSSLHRLSRPVLRQEETTLIRRLD